MRVFCFSTEFRFFFHSNLWSMRSMQIRGDIKMHYEGGGVNLAESIKSCKLTGTSNICSLFLEHGTPQQHICWERYASSVHFEWCNKLINIKISRLYSIMIIIQIKLFSSGKINVALSWHADLFAQPTAKGFVPWSDGGLAGLHPPRKFFRFFFPVVTLMPEFYNRHPVCSRLITTHIHYMFVQVENTQSPTQKEMPGTLYTFCINVKPK